MSKKVALFTSTYNNVYSGVGTYARLLVDGLLEEGYDITIVSPDCDDDPPRFIKVKRPKFCISPNGWFELSIIYNKILSDLSKNIDIVHFLDAREGLFLKRSPEVFFIGSVHDTYSWDLQSRALLKEYFLDWKKRLVYYTLLFNLEKRAYKKFDLIISNTDYVKERLRDFYDLEDKNIETVYIASPIDVTGKNFDCHPKEKIVAFVGGNFQRKGLLQLIKAVKRLKDEGILLKIIVAGKDKNQRLIEKWLRDRGFADIVEFRGHLKREEVTELLKKSAVFAMPSVTEAFGLVYLEAMAYGVPVIGSKEGGTKELIKDGWNGYLVNPYDPNDIANKIKMSLDIRERKKIIENGFATVENFSKHKFIENMKRVYSKIE
ncbi:MAG: glycosyltransferase family 4 protein [Proteobacteria bacterium]|nr:glycosyltransferase family 4 protein [Pseudomonadota bacterium]